MKEKLIIETFGSIEKKESLSSVSGFDELVLESLQPFPGYHGDTVPDSVKPQALYVFTRSKYTDEKIIRIIQKIKKDTKLKFDGSPGQVNLYNMLNPCIRIRDVDNFTTVTNVIQAFKDEGIEFMGSRKIEPYSGNIKIRKYFLVEAITNCTFHDVEDKAMHYFTIAGQLRFKQFEKLTMEIKQNMENNNFDAALGSFYRKAGLIDVIRIYDCDCDIERLSQIRARYAKGIKKLLNP